MKVGVPYRLYVNEFLYVDLLFDGENLYILPSTNVPKNTISKKDVGGKSIILINGVPRFTFNLNNREVLTHLKMIPTTAIRNFSEIINTNAEDPDYIQNHYVFTKRNVNKEIHNHTDLHNHFMEALSPERFLSLILDKTGFVGVYDNLDLVIKYPYDDNNPREFNLEGITFLSRDQIASSSILYQRIVSQLGLPIDRQTDFGEINIVLNKRNSLVDLAGYNLARNNIYLEDNPTLPRVKELVSDKKADIYIDILLATLEELKNADVKYVEFSYSNPATIVKMRNRLASVSLPKGIEFNFLLSENRCAKTESFKEYTKRADGMHRNKKSVEVHLNKLISAGYVTGFDLMGLEQEIVPSDYEKDYLTESSLYDKLEMILIKLNSFNDDSLVCRLHAGEIAYNTPNFDGKSNPERTLEILDKIVKNNNLIVPPPRIRIGHGLHFVPNANYLELLKKYKVTVEINASSNFALSNIKNLKDIPYRWYIENNIPVVLGTDGGGFYLTTTIDESNIAHLFGGLDVIKRINQTDTEELAKAQSTNKTMGGL